MANLEPRAMSRQEYEDIFARLVAGWADNLSPSSARLYGFGRHNRNDHMGPYEGVTRMLPALSAWLSQPNRPQILTWRGKEYNVAELLARTIANGCDPAVYDNWAQHSAGINQHTVEAWAVAFALWQAREYTWDTYTDEQQQNIVKYLHRYGYDVPAFTNNWIVFVAINNTVRKVLGQQYDDALLQKIEGLLDELYLGDGWFDETDDYQWWGLAKLLMAWQMIGDADYPNPRFVKSLKPSFEDFPYLFSGDGNYARWGRSLMYKFCRLVAPLWGYHMGIWPHSVGMLRRLTGAHLRWYVDRGAIRPDGLLEQTLTSTGSEYVFETYNASNSQYWAMMAFSALWTIADDDPFWTSDEEELLPLEEGDYTRVLKSAGQVLDGRQNSNNVRRYIGFIRPGAGTVYAQKYGKYVYESRFGFAVGNVGRNAVPDNILALTDGTHYGHRQENQAWAVDESGWLRFTYTELVRDKTHTIDTVIVPHGDVHLRAHRITLADGVDALQAVEGATIIPYEKAVSSLPVNLYDDEHLMVIVKDDRWGGSMGATGIRGIQGYDGMAVLYDWLGQVDMHIFQNRFMLPTLKASTITNGSSLICLAFSGNSPEEAQDQLLNSLTEAAFLDDGTLNVMWANGETVSVPPLESREA